jgi:hypothetical protein
MPAVEVNGHLFIEADLVKQVIRDVRAQADTTARMTVAWLHGARTAS